MFTKIRGMMQDETAPLSAQVEVDEAYIGGRRRGARGRGAAGKTIAMGMIERGGNAVVKGTLTPMPFATTIVRTTGPCS